MATTSIPTELCPLVLVRSVPAGIAPGAFLTSTCAALFHDADPGLPPIPAVRVYGATPESPTLATDEQLRAVVPEAKQAEILQARERVTGTLRSLYSLPAADRLLSDRLTVLAEPFGAAPAGTVVYQRTSAMGVVDFVLVHLAMDPAAGTFRLVGMPVFGRPAAPHRHRPAVEAVGAGDASDVVAAAAAVAQNLAFALPPPWGPLVAAGISLLELLMPNHKADPFAEVVKSIESYIDQKLYLEVANYVHAYGLRLNELQGDQDMLGVNPEFMKKTIAELEFATSANSPLFGYLAQMSGHADADDDALKLLVLCESMYCVTLKMTIQLYAKLAQLAQDNEQPADSASYTDSWYGAYVSLYTHMNGTGGLPGCVGRVEQLVRDRSTNRLSQISDVYRYSYTNTRFGPDGPVVYQVFGWTYKDTALGDDDMTHFHVDTTEGDACHTHQVEHRAEAQSEHDQHLTAVTHDLDTRFGPAGETAKAWAASILEWNQNMPPLRPAAVPIVPDPATWPDPAKAGTVWADYVQVRYAAAFVNAHGPSPISGWSPTVDLKGRAHPTIVLPQDPLKMATAWWVYRQFVDAKGAESPLRIIAVAPVNATGQFLDNHDNLVGAG